MARRSYGGGAVATSLVSGINSSALTFQLASATGWPNGGTGKFFLVIDRGLPTEEKILGTSLSGTTVTVASTGDRGVDGTAAAAHSTGATVEHCIAALDVSEPNAFINTPGTTADMVASASGDTASAGSSGKYADAGHRHARETGIVVPTFVLGMSGTSATTTGVAFTVPWSTEDLDSHNGHSLTVNIDRYTIPAGWDGCWWLNAVVEFPSNATGYRQVFLAVNGTPKFGDTRNAVSGVAMSIGVSGQYAGLVAGDYITVVTLQTSGGNLNLNGTSTCRFTGHWQHA